MVSDVDLMHAIRDGDLAAFDTLVLRHQAGVYNFFFRMLHSHESAEDYTQDVFFKLYKSAANYEPQAKFTTYLYRIARNCYVDHVRRSVRQGNFVSLDKETENGVNLYDHLAADTEAPDENLRREERAGVVDSLLAVLPEDQRTVLILSEVQGMKYHEIADTLDIPVGTVKSRMHTAIHRLREVVKRQQDGTGMDEGVSLQEHFPGQWTTG